MNRLILTACLIFSAQAWSALPASLAWTPWNGTDTAPLARLIWFGGYPGLPGSYMAMQQRLGTNSGTARIRLFEKTAQGLVAKDFYSLTVESAGNETGLLGLAFHPRFLENRRYFIYYMPPPENGQLHSIIEERTASPDFRSDAGLPGKILLKVPQPKNDHNGGTLHFGPGDGYLYLAFGDGGWNAYNPDPFRNGQNMSTLLAKVLRIDVDRVEEGLPYGIPADNPFATSTTIRRETWAAGLRNPWRFSFDPKPPYDLWAADVGHNNAEEINRIKPGLNYGWSIMEGKECMAVDEGDTPPECNTQGLTTPVLAFDHVSSPAAAIIGGYVYRGNPASPWYGAYLFGDNMSGNIFAMTAQGDSLTGVKDYGLTPGKIVSFGSDPLGNLFFVSWRSGNMGSVYRLELGEPLAISERTERPGMSAGPFQGLKIHRDPAGLQVQASLPGPQSLVFLLPDGRRLQTLSFQGPTVLRVPGASLPAGKVLVTWERKGLSLHKAWRF